MSEIETTTVSEAGFRHTSGFGDYDPVVDAVGDGGPRAREALVANEPIVPLDENVSRRAGALEGFHLVSDTKPDLGPADAIVAATGLTMNEPVVTNDRDFESVDGLDVRWY